MGARRGGRAGGWVRSVGAGWVGGLWGAPAGGGGLATTTAVHVQRFIIPWLIDHVYYIQRLDTAPLSTHRRTFVDSLPDERGLRISSRSGDLFAAVRPVTPEKHMTTPNYHWPARCVCVLAEGGTLVPCAIACSAPLKPTPKTPWPCSTCTSSLSRSSVPPAAPLPTPCPAPPPIASPF